MICCGTIEAGIPIKADKAETKNRWLTLCASTADFNYVPRPHLHLLVDAFAVYERTFAAEVSQDQSHVLHGHLKVLGCHRAPQALVRHERGPEASGLHRPAHPHLREQATGLQLPLLLLESQQLWPLQPARGNALEPKR